MQVEANLRMAKCQCRDMGSYLPGWVSFELRLPPSIPSQTLIAPHFGLPALLCPDDGDNIISHLQQSRRLLVDQQTMPRPWKSSPTTANLSYPIPRATTQPGLVAQTQAQPKALDPCLRRWHVVTLKTPRLHTAEPAKQRQACHQRPLLPGDGRACIDQQLRVPDVHRAVPDLSLLYLCTAQLPWTSLFPTHRLQHCRQPQRALRYRSVWLCLDTLFPCDSTSICRDHQGKSLSASPNHNKRGEVGGMNASQTLARAPIVTYCQRHSCPSLSLDSFALVFQLLTIASRTQSDNGEIRASPYANLSTVPGHGHYQTLFL